MTEKEIQKAKDEMFPYQENVGRSYEQALAASGFELGAHFVLNRIKSDGMLPKLKNPIEDNAAKASEEYRNFRMSCGINDPVMLDEIEEAYYEGAISRKSAEWGEEDEKMANDLIAGCLSSEKPYQLVHTSKEIAEWLDSVKCRMKGKED